MTAIRAASGTSSSVLTPTKNKTVGDTANRHDLFRPPPRSFVLSAALLLIDTSVSCKNGDDVGENQESTTNGSSDADNSNDGKKERNERTEPEEFVYLVPRPYLANWIGWANQQSIPAVEKSRLHLALEMAAEIHGVPFLDGDEVHNPGPVDCSLLSRPGFPLLLRPDIVHGKGDDEDELLWPSRSSIRRSGTGSYVSSPSGASSPTPSSPMVSPKNHPLRRHLSSSSLASSVATSPSATTDPEDGVDPAIENTLDVTVSVDEVKMGCCAVPERFFELLRSVHGVLCDDGISVSFQSSLAYKLPNGRHKNSSRCAVSLHHHAIQKGTFLQSKSSQHIARSDILHPSSSMSDVGYGSPPRARTNTETSIGSISVNGVNGTRTHLISAPAERTGPPRPVEFRRMVLSVPLPSSPSSSRMTTVNFMPQAQKHTKTKKVVELYPMKFIYSILDGSNGSAAAASLPASPAHSLASSGASAPALRDENDALPRADPNHIALLRGAAAKLSMESGRNELNSKNIFFPSNTTMGSGFKPPRQSGTIDLRGMQMNNSVGSLSQQPKEQVRPLFPARGFILVSRASPVVEALQALIKAAAPDTSASCVRLWSKIGKATKRQCKTRGPTMEGDGLDVIDLGTVDEKIRVETKSNSDKSKSVKLIRVPLSVSEWVKRHNSKGDAAKSIEIVVEVRNSLSAKWPRDGFELENRIKIGDFVDAQDSTGKWYEAVVRGVTEDTVKVHYLGWTSKWDSNLRRRRKRDDVEIEGCLKNALPPAPLFSHSSRWREELQLGDIVEVRDSASLVQRPKWFRGIVRAVGRDDDVPMEIVGGAELEMLETPVSNVGSDEKELVKKRRPLLLLHRTRQILVEVPQEKFNSSSTVAPSVSSTAILNRIPHGEDSPDHSHILSEPPFLRWVNLFGEEICKENTHIAPVLDNKPATISYAHDPNRPRVEILRSFNNIHGAGFVRESIRGVPPAPGSVGLHNLGNSCFLNSILQCLNHIEPLTQYFLTRTFVDDLNEDNPLGSGGNVARAYAALLNDMWGGEYSTLAPRMLKQTVAAFAPQFNNSYQHDSQEFCSFLMDGLHEDLNRVKKKPYVEDVEGFGVEDGKVAMESWRKHLLRHNSIIVDRCQGMHRSHVTCPHCGKESVKFDIYSSISLPLVPAKNELPIPLADCLEKFTAGEQLDEDNAWYCSSCKKHVCALKIMTLWSTPDILILHLKRFTFSASGRRGNIVRAKIKDQVNFPVDGLDLRPYIMGPIDEDAPPVYNLFGVSEHCGKTANSGHYTATVRNSRDGKWYRYNDSHVGSTSGEASITGGAYLLFYQRSRGKAKWAGLENIMNGRNVDPNEAPANYQDNPTEMKSKRKKRNARSN